MTWANRIERAKERVGFEKLRGFCKDDRAVAHDWETCAVGELVQDKNYIKILNSKDDRNDLDNIFLAYYYQLKDLGAKFAIQVRNDYINKSEDTYNQIKELVAKEALNDKE